MHGRLSREAGFTLLELMVALVAGLVAILAVYYVSSASARHFHEQQRVAQTQTSIRMAMQQLRRDIGRV
ncbi:MAG: prepilin-type N-terminal cleavage/methylation domain-containing protein, partial [Myxococcales bacterium]|nr:prepilin-type N-terminal cleavage/methylation domain-containing protein [Myxococcales bacterium]